MLWARLRDSADYDELLDILEMQQANADARAAAKLNADVHEMNRRAILVAERAQNGGRGG